MGYIHRRCRGRTVMGAATPRSSCALSGCAHGCATGTRVVWVGLQKGLRRASELRSTHKGLPTLGQVALIHLGPSASLC